MSNLEREEVDRVAGLWSLVAEQLGNGDLLTVKVVTPIRDSRDLGFEDK
jgi:hypothetical protein